MSEYNSRRLILKNFKCPLCQKDFKKLVQPQEKYYKCPNCFYDQCPEIIEIEPNPQKENTTKRENINSSNNNSDKNIKNNTNCENNTEERIEVLVCSGRIINGQLSIDHNNDSDEISDLFNDNIINNILSNILGLSNPAIIINREDFQNEENSPVEKNIINKLNHFKMEKKFCKKNENGELEFPKCTICLIEINEGTESISLPCEHMFHDKCITQWFGIHNTCPLCRFELSNKQFENKAFENPKDNDDSNQNL